MLAISMDTVIKWLLGELIFLIYTFTFRKKIPPKKLTPKSDGMPLGATILRCIMSTKHFTDRQKSAYYQNNSDISNTSSLIQTILSVLDFHQIISMDFNGQHPDSPESPPVF